MSEAFKKAAAMEAIRYLQNAKNINIIGVGTGSTVNYFIDALVTLKNRLEGVVASSVATEKRLKERGIPVIELNHVADVAMYVDGADAFNDHRYLVKGGGGALTREKIIATCAKQFICIVDASKQVDVLGHFPVAVEVIPMARSFVAREIVKWHGDPVYRQGVTTDNGNVILDVYNLRILDPLQLEIAFNNIPGVVGNGIFAKRQADQILVASAQGVRMIS